MDSLNQIILQAIIQKPIFSRVAALSKKDKDEVKKKVKKKLKENGNGGKKKKSPPEKGKGKAEEGKKEKDEKVVEDDDKGNSPFQKKEEEKPEKAPEDMISELQGELEAIAEDGRVTPQEVLGLVDNIMNIMNLVLQAKLPKEAMLASRVAESYMGDRLAAKGIQRHRKDRDNMSDTGGSSKGRAREPYEKPSREDQRKSPKRKTKEEKDPDNDNDPDKKASFLEIDVPKETYSDKVRGARSLVADYDKATRNFDNGMGRIADKSPNLEDIKVTVDRGGRGPTINLFSTEKPKAVRVPRRLPGNPQLTWKEEGLTLGEEWKPKQIGKLYLEKRFIHADDYAEGAPEAFKGSKSWKPQNEMAEVFAVYSVVIAGEYRNKGYGIVLYLKALELASKRGLWLVNDTKVKTSRAAKRTWKALFRYANKTIMGPPAPSKLFDYDKQEWAVGYRKWEQGRWGPFEDGKVVSTHRPMFGAYGLNGSGKKIIQAETH